MKVSLQILIAVLAISPSLADEISWLSDVTTPPANLAVKDPPLSDLLPQEQLNSPSPLAAWKSQRAKLTSEWLNVLGPLPKAPSQIRLETLSEERLDRCIRSLVRYEAEPGRFVEAFLLRPISDDSQKRPAVVVFHPTTAETANVVAGTGGRPEQHLALRLAERGFVTLSPKNFLWEEESYEKSVAAAKSRHPESLGMATMLADGMRAVDVLETLPDVDPNLIGTIGHSLGAKEVLYLMAFDERVKVGVASEGGVGLTSSNWDAPWYLGPGIKQPTFQHDHHELLALTAPRPMLILGGESGRGASDGDRSWPYITAAQNIYRFYPGPVRLAFLNHHQGHKLSPEMAEKAFDWLEAYLNEEVSGE